MCNLYSITTNQAAIINLFRVMNRYVGNLAPMPGVFPDYPAPVIRNSVRRHRDGDDALGHATTAAHRRPARHQHPQHVLAALAHVLKPENRCLVPANSFAEYAPEPNPETKKKDVVWFAVNETRPL